MFEALSQALPKDTIIFSDKENHASLVQGIRNTRLRKMIFEHNNVDQLEQQLASAPSNAPKVVVFETVYSMSGTRAPTAKLLELCQRYGAISVVDEVHAVGESCMADDAPVSQSPLLNTLPFFFFAQAFTARRAAACWMSWVCWARPTL